MYLSNRQKKETERKEKREGERKTMRGKEYQEIQAEESSLEYKERGNFKKVIGNKFCRAVKKVRTQKFLVFINQGIFLILATAVPEKWWNQRPNCSCLRSSGNMRKLKERTGSWKTGERERGRHRNQKKT